MLNLTTIKREEPFCEKLERRCAHYAKSTSKTVLIATASLSYSSSIFAICIDEGVRGAILCGLGVGITWVAQCTTETCKEEAELFKKIGIASAACLAAFATTYCLI